MTRFATSFPTQLKTCKSDYSEKVTVVGRPRPEDPPAADAGQSRKRKAPLEAAVHLQPSKVVLKGPEDTRAKKKKAEYLVDCVSPDITQSQYYAKFEGIVTSFITSRDCDAAILAYGATGSGKTFSTQGPNLARHRPDEQCQDDSHLPLSSGIIQRAIQQILEGVGDTGAVQVCAVEVYCERVRDLLAEGTAAGPDATGGEECDLLISDGRTCIRHKRDRSPLVECEVATVQTAMAVLTRALLSRAVDSTRKNDESSRSHLLVGISLCSVRPATAQQPDQLQKLATLWLGDLCGSEAFDMASSAHQQLETRAINKSLSTFNVCLHTLWQNQQKRGAAAMIPVRSSALTRILSSAMNGRGRLALSVHFSLKDEDLEATRRTLDFAERTAQIAVDARPKTPVGSAPWGEPGFVSAHQYAAVVAERDSLVAERDSLRRQLSTALARVDTQHQLLEDAYEKGFAAARKAQPQECTAAEPPTTVSGCEDMHAATPHRAGVYGCVQGKLGIGHYCRCLRGATPGGVSLAEFACDVKPLSLSHLSTGKLRAPARTARETQQQSGAGLQSLVIQSITRSPIVICSSEQASLKLADALHADEGGLHPSVEGHRRPSLAAPVPAVSPHFMNRRSIHALSTAPPTACTTGSVGRRAEDDWIAAKQRHFWDMPDQEHSSHVSAAPTAALEPDSLPPLQRTISPNLMGQVSEAAEPSIHAIGTDCEDGTRMRDACPAAELAQQAPSGAARGPPACTHHMESGGAHEEAFSGPPQATVSLDAGSLPQGQDRRSMRLSQGARLPPRHRSARRSIQEVREGRREQRAGLEEQFLSVQADVAHASTEVSPGGRASSRSRSLRASMPHSDCVGVLERAREGNDTRKAPMTRRSCSVALPSPRLGWSKPVEAAVSEVAKEACGRRASCHASGQENFQPCITVSPQGAQQSPLTELQQMMQGEPTMVPWPDHLHGHQPIGAGRRA